jgi:hypothetical protein
VAGVARRKELGGGLLRAAFIAEGSEGWWGGVVWHAVEGRRGVRSAARPENGGVGRATTTPGQRVWALPIAHETREGTDGRGVWAAVGWLAWAGSSCTMSFSNYSK